MNNKMLTRIKSFANKFKIKKFVNMSIGNKITFFYAMIFSITFILLTVFIFLNTWYYYQGVSKNELSETLNKVIEYIKNGNAIDDEEISKLNPNKNVEIRIFTASDENGFRIINKNNYRNFNNSKAQEHDTHPMPDFPMPKIEDFEKKKDRFETETVHGIPYMSRKSMVEHMGKKYFVDVFRTNESESAVLKGFGIVFVIANILGIVASFGIGRFISRKILKPVSEVTKAAERISINDLSQRIDVPDSNDEISNLASTFNDMIERLDISFEKQKQFISNASHELKTPISVIQGYASLIDRWGKSDPDILQEAIDSIKDETEYMSNLIKKLLFLARNEQSQINEQKKVISLVNVVSEVVKETSVLDINGDFNIIENGDVFIFGDFNLIKQLLWVFFENSIKYSDKDFIKVDIEILSENEFAVIKISDNGRGISEEDIPHIFDRFFRADKSHSKAVSGNGLGLSIAEIIVKQHNGKIDVSSEEGKGSQFKIYFPLAEYDDIEKEGKLWL